MKNLVFFVVEGAIEISKDSAKSELYGDESVQYPDSAYSFSIVMKEDGKIACTTLEAIKSTLGCSV